MLTGLTTPVLPITARLAGSGKTWRGLSAQAKSSVTRLGPRRVAEAGTRASTVCQPGTRACSLSTVSPLTRIETFCGGAPS